MLTGHWSHQVGLDADIWLTPMPNRELTRQEREEMMATNIVADDWMDVNPEIWSPAHIAVLQDRGAGQGGRARAGQSGDQEGTVPRREAATAPGCTRCARCYGHNYHFHIRIGCPAGQEDCKAQPPAPPDEGCGKDLDAWFTRKAV